MVEEKLPREMKDEVELRRLQFHRYSKKGQSRIWEKHPSSELYNTYLIYITPEMGNLEK